MESLVHWTLVRPWLVPAVCDLVTLLAATGALAVWLGRPRPGTLPPATDRKTEPCALPRAAEVPTNRLRAPESSTTAPARLTSEKPRTAVDRAVAAMAAWEATYRPAGRGLAELARLAQTAGDGTTNRLRKVQ